MTVTRTSPKAAPKRSASPKASPKASPTETASGPKAETLAFAKRVVSLRDGGKSWSEVAEALGIDYSSGYSSKLRRAYSIGGGETAGVRTRANAAKRAAEASRAAAEASRAAARSSSRKTKRSASKTARETATARRARLGRESAAAKAGK